MKIVIIGAKASGKSSVGKQLAGLLDMHYTETDELIEDIHCQENDTEKKSCKDIFDLLGADAFRQLEERAVAATTAYDWRILITGGSTFVSPANRRVLRSNAIIVYCRCDIETLIARVDSQTALTGGLSRAVFIDWYKKDIAYKDEIYRGFADIILDTGTDDPAALAHKARRRIGEELAVRCTAANTFGELVRITTFGESHGEALGAILEGIPAGIGLTKEDIQKELDRRKPGQSVVTTPRRESDAVHVLSGLFDGKTTGTPIGMVVYNKDSDSSKYEAIKDVFRPGHADFTFYRKYGMRDYRGGGRSSGRETVARVAGGAVAKKVLHERGVSVFAHSIEIGGIQAQRFDYAQIEKNMVRCGDKDAASAMVEALEQARAQKDSLGGLVQLEIHGLPAGLGDPVFAKFDARMVYALMTLGAVKGVEIGDGFAMARLRGSESNDAMKDGDFVTNHAGGVLGGISTGQPFVARIAVKPTPSIAQQQETIDMHGTNSTVVVEGRHDPCIVPRVVPVIESMAALVVLDAWQIQSRLHPEWNARAQKD
jgi:chorismate synthase